jgi:2,4-didehydro-3-deoxy-L-rhamnonate hydrolase
MHFGLGTFSHAGSALFPGLVLGERVIALTRLGTLLSRLNLQLDGADSVLSLLSNWEANFAALAAIAAALKEAEPSRQPARVGGSRGSSDTSDSINVHELNVHAPIHLPRQIFCAIGNYRSHIVDTLREPAASLRLSEPQSAECTARAATLIEERLHGVPYICLKLPSTVSGAADALEIPYHTQCVDWELELGVVIGRSGRRIARQHAMKFVAGYTLVNDITVRELVVRPDLPRLGSDWLQSKCAPGFLPMGPYFIPAALVADPYALRLTLRLNGEIMQDELVADMLFDIATQIEYISQHAQLLPGDVICTGTPAGCGTRYKRFLKPGDVMEATAQGMGAQRTACIAERVAPPA